MLKILNKASKITKLSKPFLKQTIKTFSTQREAAQVDDHLGGTAVLHLWPLILGLCQAQCFFRFVEFKLLNFIFILNHFFVVKNNHKGYKYSEEQ